MTDAGGVRPGRDDADPPDRARLLRRIADALDLPVEAFAGARPVGANAEPGPSTAECAAALDAFSRIRDPEMRRRCLRMLERCAGA